MARKRNDHDPFEARRRRLAEQERALADQRRRLNLRLAQTETPAAQAKRLEPPVWRLEDDAPASRMPEPTAARRRNLAHKRQRDKLIFLASFILLLVVVSIALWVMHVHNLAPSNGT